MGRVLVVYSVVLLLGCTEHSNELDESKEKLCERLRNHVVDLKVAQLAPTVGPSAEELARMGEKRPPQAQPSVAEGHRAALTHALGDEYISTCVTSVTADQLACSLKAKDTDGLVSCQNH